MDAVGCHDSDDRGNNQDSIQNIDGPGKEGNDNPLEAASQEFDQIDIHKNGELDWDQFCRIVIKGFKDMVWDAR